ncbi:MAG TPA: 2-oxo-4-hydroxy-4-carboxy-5-ureidoimidazoline decarboxylase [Gaiellaceae bacterium]|nr:2-oxo-4-hydroxy-4-carboxy-5-ureidoimidazoline decarboxylase [Gaiellaceae bacterium]
MRDLPRQLTVDELAELFGAHTRLVELLAEREDPLGAARDVIAQLSEEDKAAALAAHPRIGEPSPEQRGGDPAVLAELAYLNQVYEEKFGFRFVVFVSRRSRAELLPVLQERLGRTREEELETGLEELVRIAEDRWRRG